jgi:hypothetical protein
VKKVNFLMAAALIIAAVVLSMIFLIGCNTLVPEKEEPKKEAAIPAVPNAVSNPNFSTAPGEYAELGEKLLNLMAKFDGRAQHTG